MFEAEYEIQVVRVKPEPGKMICDEDWWGSGAVLPRILPSLVKDTSTVLT